MADIVHDPRLADQELQAHQKTFHAFGKLVLFSILHIGLVLACLALAFLGNVPVVAALLGIGGTVVLLVIFAISK
jgi:energy-converting hydrogenase Eha subunit C